MNNRSGADWGAQPPAQQQAEDDEYLTMTLDILKRLHEKFYAEGGGEPGEGEKRVEDDKPKLRLHFPHPPPFNRSLSLSLASQNTRGPLPSSSSRCVPPYFPPAASSCSAAS